MKHMTQRDPQLGKWLGTAALGALVMYMLDPDRGRSRRARSGQQLAGLTKKTGTMLERAVRDIGNRLGGVQARMVHLAAKSGTTDDQVLVERVRSALGRAVSNPHAVTVSAQAGHITIGGPVLASEKHALLDAAQAVHGVAGVTDHTETHERPDGASSLQGTIQARPRPAVQHQWAPAMRSAAVLGGGALGLYALMRRRSPLAMALGVAGIAMLARGATNQPFARMIGAKGQPYAIDIQKSIRIEASPEQVYDLWTNYENFPRFMSHVVEVRDLSNQRTHWVVKGPAGTEFEWDALHTEQSRPHRLAWRSEPGSQIEQAGSVQFEPSRGGTRVTVHLAYTPPAGVVGHAIATLLGSDPKRQMDDDLARMKTFIERGAVPHDAAQQSAASSKFLH